MCRTKGGAALQVMRSRFVRDQLGMGAAVAVAISVVAVLFLGVTFANVVHSRAVFGNHFAEFN
jgi:hypothetical protein